MRRTNSAVALMAMTAGLAMAVGGSAMQVQRDPVPSIDIGRSHSGRHSGKGRNKHPHSLGGTRAHQRLALKKRNQARHRKACR